MAQNGAKRPIFKLGCLSASSLAEDTGMELPFETTVPGSGASDECYGVEIWITH